MGDPTPADSAEFRHGAAALLGVHLGDSLGVTTEFSDRVRARQLLPPDVDDVDVVGGGAFDWSPGAASDDTDLTVAVARGYLDTDLGETDHVVAAGADHMLEWMRRGPRDIGGATAAGLRAYARHGDPAASGVDDERSQGNGSLMRTVPVALARLTDPQLRAREAAALSAVTHAHRVCRDACVAYCDLIADLVLAGRVDRDQGSLRVRVQASSQDVRLASAVRDAISTGADRTVDEVDGVNGPGAGWVLTSLQVAVAALLDPRPAAQVLLDVVRLGGDADTSGAIAGGLLGARDGWEAWPQRWLDVLEHRVVLLEAAHVLTAGQSSGAPDVAGG